MSTQLDMKYVQSMKALADKYMDVMHTSLEKQDHIDARQCVYYTAYGATLALFEALAALIMSLPRDQKGNLAEVQRAAQYVLDLCRKVEQMRKNEATAWEEAARQSKANKDKLK